MLDSFQIFTKGGLILFQWALMDVPKGGPVDELIKQCLLEDRAGETEFTHNAGANAYTLRWRVDNKFGLVFVAVYQKILRLDYVDDLLESIKGAFAENFDTSLMKLSYPEFEEVFTKTLKKEELKANERKAPKTAPKAFDPAAKAAKRNDASGVAKGNDKEDENKNSKRSNVRLSKQHNIFLKQAQTCFLSCTTENITRTFTATTQQKFLNIFLQNRPVCFTANLQVRRRFRA